MHEALQELLSPNILALLVSLGIGLVFGLEREVDALPEYRHLTGIRSMPLLAMLGTALTIIALQVGTAILVASILGMFILVVCIFYKKNPSQIDIRQEITLLVVFVAGVFCGRHLFHEAIFLTVVVVTILSFKEQLHYFLDKVSKEELIAFVKFAILFAILLPLVPDKQFGPSGIINPREIAWVVVIVSFLGFVGYLFLKFGKTQKGILLTAALGGLFSSTAVTWAYSTKSKEQKDVAHLYASGILLASAIMFVRILFFSYLFNVSVFKSLIIPCGAMIGILLTATGFILWKKNKSKSVTIPELGSPLELTNALFFGVVYTLIILMVFYANKFWGTAGQYASGIISGFSDVDAITINMAKTSAGIGNTEVASSVIILASFSNNLVKFIVSLIKGDSTLKKYVGISFTIVLFGSIAFFLFRVF